MQGTALRVQRHNRCLEGIYHVRMRETGQYEIARNARYVRTWEAQRLLQERRGGRSHSALVQSRQASWRKRSLNWASRRGGVLGKKRRQVRIIPGEKVDNHRTTWLEKRAVSNSTITSWQEWRNFLLTLFHWGNNGPSNSTSFHRGWSWVFMEIINSVSQKERKGHFYI